MFAEAANIYSYIGDFSQRRVRALGPPPLGLWWRPRPAPRALTAVCPGARYPADRWTSPPSPSSSRPQAAAAAKVPVRSAHFTPQHDTLERTLPPCTCMCVDPPCVNAEQHHRGCVVRVCLRVRCLSVYFQKGRPRACVEEQPNRVPTYSTRALVLHPRCT